MSCSAASAFAPSPSRCCKRWLWRRFSAACAATIGAGWSIAGVLLGLTAYTYLAARLFPVLLLLGLLPLLLNRGAWPKRWRQLGIIVAAALIVLSPLLVYFVDHPDAFWVRIGQVAPGASPQGSVFTIWESLLKSWGMFFLQGDPFLAL